MIGPGTLMKQRHSQRPTPLTRVSFTLVTLLSGLMRHSRWPRRSHIPVSINTRYEYFCWLIILLTNLDFVENTDPTQEYIDAAKPKVLEHMMYGAARLAALMVDIYGSKQEDNASCMTPGSLCNPFDDLCCLKNCTSGGVCGHAAFTIPDAFLQW